MYLVKNESKLSKNKINSIITDPPRLFLLNLIILYPCYSVMQAKLPDVNAQLLRHKAEAIDAYDEKDPKKAGIHINQCIALLPEDYKINIDDDEYQRLTARRRLYICNDCKDSYKPPKVVKSEDLEQGGTVEPLPYEFEIDTIQPYELLLSKLDAFIIGQSVIRVWDCPKCGNTRPIDSTDIITEEQQQPIYYKVIPFPPKREGFHDRLGYASKFWAWYDLAMRELNNQIGRYRRDYAAQQEALDVGSMPFLDPESEINDNGN